MVAAVKTPSPGPEIDYTQTIYHVWKMAASGNMMYRVQKNFRTRQAASAWLDRNGYAKVQFGDRPMKTGIVLACEPEKRWACGCSENQGQGRVNQYG